MQTSEPTPATPANPAAQHAVRMYQLVQAMEDERHGRDDYAEATAWAVGVLCGIAVVCLVFQPWVR